MLKNDFATAIDVMNDRDIVRFEFKINCNGISHIATTPMLRELSCNLQILSATTLIRAIYITMAYFKGCFE